MRAVPGESRRRQGACLLAMSLIFSSILTEDLPDTVATLIGVTSIFGGGARYAAVLADRPERDVERATAVGFFVGFGIAILILAIDALT